MNIKRSKSFLKDFKKCSPTIQKKAILRLELFFKAPKDRRLNIHKLSGNLQPLYSMNITGDYRIWFSYQGSTLLLLRIGTHAQLYK